VHGVALSCPWAGGVRSAIRAKHSAGVFAFTIFWCISCIEFMRGSSSDMDPATPTALGAMPVEGGTAVVVPGLAQADARVVTDGATSVRRACT